MIEGLKIQLTTEQVADLLRQHADAHEKKVEWYEAEAKKWNEANAEVNIQEKPQGAYEMERKAREGKEVVKYARFLMEHLIPDEVYRLDKSDLQLMGVSGYSRYY